jgi:phage terminase Nu1 subunit (DNA packaging protein)
MARFIDVTPRHVRRLQNDGVLSLARDEDGQEKRGRYELLPNNIAYIRYLRRKAQMDDTSESEYMKLRNRRTAADAESAELDLQLKRGRLHGAGDVEFVVVTMITAAKSRLLAIPSRVTRLIVGMTDFQTIHDLIGKEIESVLKELSGFNRKMFSRQNRDHIRQSENGDDHRDGE